MKLQVGMTVRVRDDARGATGKFRNASRGLASLRAAA